MAIASRRENNRAGRNTEKRLELTEHLAELRSRIIRSALYIFAGFLVCYYRFAPLYRLLFHPMMLAMGKRQDWKIVFTTFTSPFMVVLQVSMVAGMILSAPLITLELWSFIGPALTKEEKRPLRYIAPMSIGLFIAGVSLAYWVARYAIIWFVSFVPLFPNGVLYQDPKMYVMFILKMMGIFGLVFQLPCVLAFLAWVGMLKSAAMKRTWRHAIIIITVVGLVITPSNDFFSMFMMILPVIALYLGSILLVQFIEHRREKSMAK